MSSIATRTVCAALLLALLSACGQRGALTLPDKKKQTTSAPAGTTSPDKKKQDDAKP